jgi:DNA-binding transcriptional MocR family regulator
MYSHEYHEAILASDLTANAKLTALAISYHYNWKKAMASFPSIATLVQRTSLSRATIYRAKNELIDAGFLNSTRRFNDSNLYLPVIPAQSHTDTLGVSEGRTNYEYNYEVNYEEDANASLGLNNNVIQGEYWKVFDNEERYTRRHAAAGRNKESRRSNPTLGRHNSSSEGVTGLHQELENIGGE